MIELLSDPQAWIAFLTLTGLELVLGIDNIIFISILVDKLPPDRRETARRIGLFLAMFMRGRPLLILSWIVGLTQPLFKVLQFSISGRDLILILGGMFLLWKSTKEIHQLLEGEEGEGSSAAGSTFTADHHPDHADRHRVLARLDHHRGRHGQPGLDDDRRGGRLGRADDGVRGADRQLRVGASDSEDAGTVVPAGHRTGADRRRLRQPHARRAYVYFAMAFSVFVEMLNLRMKKRRGEAGRVARALHARQIIGSGPDKRGQAPISAVIPAQAGIQHLTGGNTL
jgi:hypothetical protein